MNSPSKLHGLVAAALACATLSLPSLAQQEPGYRDAERERMRDEYRRGYDDGYAEGYRKGLDEGRSQIVAPPPPPPPPVRYIRQIVITRAIYGIDRRLCDAAPAISARVSGQEYAVIEAGNNLCGDPARDLTKRLDVHYVCGGGGATRTAFAKERDSVVLDCRR
jgi:hypothetical protein